MKSTTKEERRERNRVPVRVPILMEWRADRGIIRRTRGTTHNVTPHGVYCFVEEPVPSGQTVEFDVVFSEELTAAKPLAWHCRGTTTRCEARERRFGLAASIKAREPLDLADRGTDPERRVRKRVKLDISLVVDYPGLNAAIRDLSTTGAFIEDERPLPIGRSLEIRLRGDKTGQAIELRAIVRRVEPQMGMAVEFVSLSEEAAARLRELVG